MKKATGIIEQEFNNSNIKCRTQSLQEFSFVEAGFSGDNTMFTLRFISFDDDMDVKALTDCIAKAPKNKQPQVIVVLNQLNREYKYAKFVMDPEGCITAEYDFPIATTEELVGKFAVEIALRMSDIVDKAYNNITKAIYA